MQIADTAIKMILRDLLCLPLLFSHSGSVAPSGLSIEKHPFPRAAARGYRTDAAPRLIHTGF